MGAILITGGSGFVGSEIRRHLTDRDVRVLSRHADASPASATETQVRGDVLDPTTLATAMDGIETVIHLVAIIEESGGRTFDQVIRQGTENVVAAAERAQIKRFIHMSALGARDDPAYPYLRAKWQAEESVRAAPFAWTIFRPSVIFGPGDGFINVLAGLVRKAPVIPVAGKGLSKFQPVAIAEIGGMFRHALDHEETIGKTYEIGGGETYTYNEMLDLIAAHLGKRRSKVHLPVPLVKSAVVLSSPLPKRLRPPVTSEQLNMLALDNCTDDSAAAELLGKEPMALRDGLGYIKR